MELTGIALGTLPVRAALAEESSGGIGALGISLPNLIWQIVGFLIILFLLNRFAYKPFLRALDERRARAQEIVDKSDQIRKEALESEQRTREIIGNAQREAQQIIASATARQQQIVEETAARQRQVEEQEIAKAREQIRSERDQAVQQLRHEFADLAVLAASKIVRQELKLNPQLQNQLINETLSGQAADGGSDTGRTTPAVPPQR
jgi:F-type H+-transporting ATPase subunit b